MQNKWELYRLVIEMVNAAGVMTEHEVCDELDAIDPDVVHDAIQYLSWVRLIRKIPPHESHAVTYSVPRRTVRTLLDVTEPNSVL